MITREQYINFKCSHREYYAQFVNADTKNAVRDFIGENLLRISFKRDKNFNDIPLSIWDSCPFKYNAKLMIECGDFLTPAGQVCILKEAALQIINQ